MQNMLLLSREEADQFTQNFLAVETAKEEARSTLDMFTSAKDEAMLEIEESRQEMIELKNEMLSHRDETTSIRDDTVTQLATVKKMVANLWLDVTQYGAVGDKVTDNSPALQKLFDSIPDDGQVRVIWFPPGFYGIGSTLKLDKSNIIIDGPGILWSLGTGTSRRSMLQVNTYRELDLTEHRLQNITIRNIGIDMSIPYNKDPIEFDDAWKTDAGMVVGCLIVKGCDNLTLDSLYLRKVVHAGINVKGCYDVSVNNCTVDMLRSYTYGDGVIWGGNAIDLMPYGAISPNAPPVKSITNGRIGKYTLTNCHVYGSEVWPQPQVNNVTNQCMVGINTMVGCPNVGEHQIDPIIISGCTVERCAWGIFCEGMDAGGCGDVVIVGNAIKNCVVGAGLYPDCPGDVGHHSHDFQFTSNKLENIYTYAIDCNGENVIIADNIIKDWGALTSDVPNSIHQMTDAYAMVIRPTYSGVTTEGVYKNVVIHHNIMTISQPHDDSYVSPIKGILIDNRQSGKIFRDIKITGNILDGGKSTYSKNTWDVGIMVTGLVQGITIRGNTITGFPKGAIGFVYAADATEAASHVVIRDNEFYDLCWGAVNPQEAIVVYSPLPCWDISENRVYQLDGTNLNGLVIFFPVNDIKPDKVTMTNNLIWL